MGLRFHKFEEAQPPASTTRTGDDAGWSIRTWTGQIEPPAPQVSDDEQHDDEAVSDE